MRWVAVMAVFLFGGAPALAGDVIVRVEDLRNDSGSVLVAICTADEFLSPDCRYRGRVEAGAGSVEATVPGVPAGAYAVQAIHDENDNLDLDRNFLGMPREGMGFSRDAPMRMGPPRFSDAVVDFGDAGGSVTLSMRYF